MTCTGCLDLSNSIAGQYGIPPSILAGVLQQETGGAGPINENTWNPSAVGTSGEQGLGQLLPSIQSQYGVTNPFDPTQNISGAAAYLRDLYNQYGNWTSALSAYNSGSPNSTAGMQYAASVLNNAGGITGANVPGTTIPAGSSGSGSSGNPSQRSVFQNVLLYGGAILFVILLVIFGLYGTVKEA